MSHSWWRQRISPQLSSQLIFTFFGTCYNINGINFRITRLNVHPGEWGSHNCLGGPLCSGAIGCSLVSLVLNPALSAVAKSHHQQQNFLFRKEEYHKMVSRRKSLERLSPSLHADCHRLSIGATSPYQPCTMWANVTAFTVKSRRFFALFTFVLVI